MDIKHYWTERAASDSANATTNDVHLRDLERATLVGRLRALGCSAQSRILDAGCGDGQTVFALAAEFGCRLVGRDYASSMIELAKTRLASDPNPLVDFAIGDVRRVADEFGAEAFDFVTTDRCLINLESEAEQYAAIEGIAKALKPGGRYLAIENFVEGNDRLNELRALFDLPPIAVRWHNRFFREGEFIERMRGCFRSVEKFEFSSAYYLATRVIYSRLCAIEGVAPDYRHPIHADSVKLPVVGDFSPIKLFVLAK
ncbi:MAG: class I SAM-dependent methyltransferase [Roseiarcus sp.]|jgi:SAM-dependent methyltransferase